MPFGTRTIRAPRGTALTCKGWPQEAALRMLMNNLDPDAAERPDDLVVAPPLAATMNGAAALIVEVDPRRIRRRLDTRYLDEATTSLDDALARTAAWRRDRQARSI